MYAAYYMCRYNFRFATPGMQDEFGFTTTQIADMLAIWSLTYGTGQLVNGLLTDRIGGKRSMQIGAFGTIIVNVAMGLLPLLVVGGALAAAAKFVFRTDFIDPAFGAIALVWLINGWFQSFGAPGMIKINAAWFRRQLEALPHYPQRHFARHPRRRARPMALALHHSSRSHPRRRRLHESGGQAVT